MCVIWTVSENTEFSGHEQQQRGAPRSAGLRRPQMVCATFHRDVQEVERLRVVDCVHISNLSAA